MEYLQQAAKEQGALEDRVPSENDRLVQGEIMNLVSAQSLGKRVQRNGAPPVPQTAGEWERDSKKAKRRECAESREMARVYCEWTGKESAPWCDKKFKLADRKQKKNAKAKKRRLNIEKLHNDTCDALIKSGHTRREAIIPFCGATYLLFSRYGGGGGGKGKSKKRHRKRQGSIGDGNEKAHAGLDPLRLMVVLWAPGTVAAKRRSIFVENTPENAIVQLLRRALKPIKRPIHVDITYVMPRWKRNDSGIGHFAATKPADIAYGIWRLGMHAIYNTPDVILSTSIDVSRVIEHSGGLNPSAFLTEDIKAAIAQLPVIDMDPTALSRLPTLPAPIKRIVRGGLLELPDNPALGTPSSRGGIPHCRIPHPYLMSSDAIHKEIRQQHHIILLRVLEFVRTRVTPSLHHSVFKQQQQNRKKRKHDGQVGKDRGEQEQQQQQPQQKKARISLSRRGDPSDPVLGEKKDEYQPVLVLRQQQDP